LVIQQAGEMSCAERQVYAGGVQRRADSLLHQELLHSVVAATVLALLMKGKLS